MAGVAVVLIYVAAAGLLLAGGDRLGMYIGSAALRRSRRIPLLHFRAWMLIPIAVLVPGLVFAGFLTVLVGVHAGNAIEVLADNLELILLGVFFVTGVIGGFLDYARRG